MPQIRSYEPRDKKAVQDICLITSVGLDAEFKLQRHILACYCNYYLEKEPQNCFVLTNDADEAVGYILCAENYFAYEESFTRIYLTQARCLGLKYYIESKAEIVAHRVFRNDFPSHLHINLLPEYQGKGYGTMLLDTLKAHLKAQGYSSLMLVCGTSNTGAINFYTKNGFVELLRMDMKPIKGVAMGTVF